ncbi:hypothetical protein GIY23_12790 [Allosaccharopolyspora coralli]|uniref:RNA polymerase-binding protein RbpA n=1 Tax=Allosaccharopolyspora coralli TaxID=2665642 RepID=A0A5Q3Q730_9PSEU|nr:RNA polymerase-binding protein RbpA [Allosaccharopolyspora coralli]QGK70282.1 hypothetical protein GIY23_12790 [Allosaccharopolyspora coralli]
MKLRGDRHGRTSYEHPGSYEPAGRRSVGYSCAHGHTFEVPLASDVDAPAVWDCRQHGTEATILHEPEHEQKHAKPARTHWDMLLERRSIPELEDLLAERLRLLRG